MVPHMNKGTPDTYEPKLTDRERERLREIETVIEEIAEQTGRMWTEVAAVLAEVRDKKLYRGQYATYEQYCRERFQRSRRHINRMIEGAAVVAILGPRGPTVENERVARAIAPLAKADPERAREVLEAVPVGSSASHIAAVAEEAQAQPDVPATTIAQTVAKKPARKPTPKPAVPTEPLPEPVEKFKHWITKGPKIADFDPVDIADRVDDEMAASIEAEGKAWARFSTKFRNARSKTLRLLKS
jgi:hypothetical protein